MPEHAPEKQQANLSALSETGPVSLAPGLDSKRRGRLLSYFTFLALLVLLFIVPLASLAVHAAGSELHSYILLVPFVAAYLLYTQRKQLPKQYKSCPRLAIVPLVASLAALAVGWTLRATGDRLSHNDFLALMALSFVFQLAVIGFLFLGRDWMAAAAFPFAFLIFMVPLPDFAVDWLETGSKLASAEAANLFFNITGTPTLRYSTTVFELPNLFIEVGQECSGIRSSLVLFISSLLAGHLFLKSPWRRMVLVAFVIPLGIIRNGFRILVIGLLCIHLGPQMIHSVVHRRGGPLFFALSLIPLFLLLWCLRRGETGAATSGGKEVRAATPPRP
jgi:exosortase C (VPDSG-CTERM-specific)